MWKKVLIRPNTYRDSYNLMLLNNVLNSQLDILAAAVLMGTPNNLKRLSELGFSQDDFTLASTDDICIGLISETEEGLSHAEQLAGDFLDGKHDLFQDGEELEQVDHLEDAYNLLEQPSITLISIPGEAAVVETEKALNLGMNVFLFSDGISLMDEMRLKTIADSRNLIVMGPDCGTASIQGIPLGFVNAVRRGSIGFVGASGTGMQEVMCHLHALGEGISHAIGTGGRDMTEQVGGITSRRALEMLREDEDTAIIIFIAKYGSANIQDRLLQSLMDYSKPIVFHCQETTPTGDLPPNFYVASSLRHVAEIAHALHQRIAVPDELNFADIELPHAMVLDKQSMRQGDSRVVGLYSGGTLAAEASITLTRLNPALIHDIQDLGSEAYTDGRLHPMMDPTERIRLLDMALHNPETTVILLDLVLGFGSHPDPAPLFADCIRHVRETNREARRWPIIIAVIVGTEEDPQHLNRQLDVLHNVGIITTRSHLEAVYIAARLSGVDREEGGIEQAPVKATD